MLLVSLLIFLKTLLFIGITEIQKNLFLVFFVSTSISLFAMYLIYTRRSEKRKLYIGIYYTVISLILFIDVLYYSHFNILPSIAMLNQIKLLSNVSASVKALINFKELLFLIDLPFVYWYIKHKLNDIEEYVPRKMKKRIPVVFLVLLLVSFSYTELKGLNNSLKYQEPYSYHVMDIIDKIKLNLNVEAAGYNIDKDLLKDLKDRASYKEGNLTGIGKGKNLIVIQVEALQNFVIGLKYNNQEITPNLNKFIKENSSIYYNNFFHMTARGNTSDAEFVSNNSLYPAKDAPSYSQYEENDFHGLPWVLRENGYRTMAFHGFEKNFWNRDRAYVKQGFERFYSQDDYRYNEKINLGIGDEEFFIQNVAKLKNFKEKNDKPFYGFMVTLTSHDPFVMPEEYSNINLLERHKDSIIGDYLQSINYFDHAFGVFLEELKAAGLYDNTVIALYGDHFAIQDNEKTNYLMSEIVKRRYSYQDIMNVPLIINVPNTNIGKVESNVGSQLDFFPTILNIMGYENKNGIVFGRDLNNLNVKNFFAPQSIMQEGSFITDDVVFDVPKTREFEDSSVIFRKNGAEHDVWLYKDIYDQAQKEVELSQYILKNNLMEELRNENNKK